jgi:hypothetical protein
MEGVYNTRRAHGALLGRGIDGVRDGIGHFLADEESPQKLAGRKGVRLRQSVVCSTMSKVPRRWYGIKRPSSARLT